MLRFRLWNLLLRFYLMLLVCLWCNASALSASRTFIFLWSRELLAVQLFGTTQPLARIFPARKSKLSAGINGKCKVHAQAQLVKCWQAFARCQIIAQPIFQWIAAGEYKTAGGAWSRGQYNISVLHGCAIKRSNTWKGSILKHMSKQNNK